MMLCRRSVVVASRRVFAAAASSWPTRRFSSTAGAAGTEGAKESPSAAPKEGAPKIDTQDHNWQAEMKTLKEELAAANKSHLYAVADAENARRIAREDVVKAKDFSVSSFAKDMLEVSDTLEKAIESLLKVDQELLSKHVPLQHTVTGIKLAQSVLTKNLGRHGVEAMEAARGTTFDPNRHDAIFTAPATADVKEGQIVNCVTKGYMIKERVLRPAQVGVAEKPPQ